ncbi:NAD(+) diphosphatase [Sediminivirga luteola]|uniref:NAD(+) diphosphatase n=1 Tax=Sediminivirga luteola TaxID=1774748 RepID=A0A8J2TW83_9MICO|nr:NAD(+) diphosphatase [Sediminivirga luteola]MCI2265680.1 NAD(+) diphosphatase [Sediminivirga luteola]GGA07450.1 hypothetical protein GCM10011333_07700 [Sediminivirga luteola]
MNAFPQLPLARLSRSGSDRNYLQRGTDADLSAVWERPGTTAIVTHRGETLASQGSLVRLHRDELPAERIDVYLGRIKDSGHDVIGAILDDAGRSWLDSRLEEATVRAGTGGLDDDIGGLDALGPVWLHLREIGAELPDTDVGLLTPLVALANWHASYGHSPRTGRPTEIRAGGWARRDPEDGSEYFPRTDPAVIVAVLATGDDGEERLLLAHNALWDSKRYSVLAGFIEAGESAEGAVVREIHEEVGVEVLEQAYAGSQPWPFPASLMLAFYARAAHAEVKVDGTEILHARWFTRAELRAGMEAGEIHVPSPVSIARALIDAWLAAGEDSQR